MPVAMLLHGGATAWEDGVLSAILRESLGFSRPPVYWLRGIRAARLAMVRWWHHPARRKLGPFRPRSSACRVHVALPIALAFGGPGRLRRLRPRLSKVEATRCGGVFPAAEAVRVEPEPLPQPFHDGS